MSLIYFYFTVCLIYAVGRMVWHQCAMAPNFCWMWLTATYSEKGGHQVRQSITMKDYGVDRVIMYQDLRADILKKIFPHYTEDLEFYVESEDCKFDIKFGKPRALGSPLILPFVCWYDVFTFGVYFGIAWSIISGFILFGHYFGDLIL